MLASGVPGNTGNIGDIGNTGWQQGGLPEGKAIACPSLREPRQTKTRCSRCVRYFRYFRNAWGTHARWNSPGRASPPLGVTLGCCRHVGVLEPSRLFTFPNSGTPRSESNSSHLACGERRVGRYGREPHWFSFIRISTIGLFECFCNCFCNILVFRPIVIFVKPGQHAIGTASPFVLSAIIGVKSGPIQNLAQHGNGHAGVLLSQFERNLHNGVTCRELFRVQSPCKNAQELLCHLVVREKLVFHRKERSISFQYGTQLARIEFRLVFIMAVHDSLWMRNVHDQGFPDFEHAKIGTVISENRFAGVAVRKVSVTIFSLAGYEHNIWCKKLFEMGIVINCVARVFHNCMHLLECLAFFTAHASAHFLDPGWLIDSGSSI